MRFTLYFFPILCFLTLQAQAQSPGFNYQAVIRDATGKVLTNTTVNLEFDIFNQNGTMGCQHAANGLQTNEFGVVNTVINPPCLGNVDWAAGGAYMRVRLNGSQLPGNQPLNYVPYAILADSVLHERNYTGSGGVVVGNDAVISLAPEVDINKADDVLKTDLFGGDVTGTYNNIQILPGTVTSNKIANGTIQTEDLSNMGAINGQVLTWNGAAWVPATPGPGADNWGTQTAVTAAPLTGNGAALPLSIAPQGITNLYLADNAVNSAKIANGTVTGADLADMGAAAGQVLKWNGAAWVPSPDAGLTSVNVDAPLFGNGAGLPLSVAPNSINTSYLADNAVNSSKILNGTITTADLSNMGASTGQMLKWNGAAWAPANDLGLMSVSTVSPITGNGVDQSLTLAPNSITNAFLADNAVTGTKIANGTITSADLGSLGASTSGQILKWNGSTWTAADPGNNAVNTLNPLTGDGVNTPITIANAAITSTYLAQGAVNSATIQDGAIQSTDLDNSISKALWNLGNDDDIYRTAGKIGIGMTNPVVKVDIRSSEGGINVVNSNPALSDFTAVRGSSRTVDFYGIGGDFEGGFIGIRSKVEPTGSNTYYGAYATAVGGIINSTKYGIYAEASGTGNNYAVYGKAANGFPNYAGFFEGNVTVTGNFSVDGIKSFRVKHPEDPSKEIWYACIEGPEAAAYVRGTAQLINGEAFIPFPEHFKLIINPASLTVIITPSSTDTYGLAVVEKSAEGFKIKELKGGNGSFSFDWEAKAVRKGTEQFEVIRTAEPIPSKGKER